MFFGVQVRQEHAHGRFGSRRVCYGAVHRGAWVITVSETEMKFHQHASDSVSTNINYLPEGPHISFADLLVC